jgi:DNA-binding MarR family transcriptional regulator
VTPGGRADAPQLIRGDEGGPLSRRLIVVRVIQLARFIRRGADLLYPRVSGLSDFEWRLLARVCETPGLSVSELGAQMELSIAQASRGVKRLVLAGLLRRENIGGGPGVAISPTPLGRTVYAPLVELAIEADRELTAGISEADLQALDRIIVTMTRNALARVAREQALLSGDDG